MEISLYNANGEAVAYIADDGENSIYTWEGHAVAYILDNGTAYGWRGQHIGWFVGGVLYDINGYRVGSIREQTSESAKRYKRLRCRFGSLGESMRLA